MSNIDTKHSPSFTRWQIKTPPTLGYCEDTALFNGVVDPLLRSYNRAVMAIFLREQASGRVYQRYMASFSPVDQAAVAQMIAQIDAGEDHEIKKVVKYRLNWSVEDNRVVYDAWIRGVCGRKWNWY